MTSQEHLDALIALLHGWHERHRSGVDGAPNCEWPSGLVSLADRHGLLPVLHAANTGTRLHGWKRQNDLRMLGLAAETVRLSYALERVGIPVLSLKGAAIAQSLYGDFGFRQATDVDLIVAVEDAPAAIEFLRSQGYLLELSVGHLSSAEIAACNTEIPLSHPHRGVEVDLHWGIAPRHSPHWVDPAFLWRKTARTALCGRPVAVPGPEALLIFLAVHGARHVWERLIWAVDIAMLLAGNPGMDWAWIDEFARRHSLQAVISLALEVAHRATGCAVRHTANPLTDRAARIVGATWASENAPGTRETLRLTALLTSSRYRLGRHVLGLAARPTESDWRVARLSGAYLPLYRLIRAGRLLGRAFTASNYLERQTR
ncbi:MAG: nucleotidyltransferase family protein [Bryobacteraceae bacterium]